MTARFINQSGYDWVQRPDMTVKGLIWDKMVYEYAAHPVKPLTFVDDAGLMYRPDRHFYSDGGSIPMAMTCIPGFARDRHLLPYIFHDSAYRHQGVFASSTGKDFAFTSLTRLQADCMLRYMIASEQAPGGMINRGAIWLGVRLFGWLCWGNGDARKDPPDAGLDLTKPVPMVRG